MAGESLAQAGGAGIVAPGIVAPGIVGAGAAAARPAETPQAWIEAGMAHHRTGALAAAAAAFAVALDHAPEDGQLLKLAGLLALQRARLGEAAGTLAAASRRLPDDPDLHCALSMVLREQGDFAGAIEAGRRAVALRPGDGDGHLALGRALLRAGACAEAVLALLCARKTSGRPEIAGFLELALGAAGLTAETVTTLDRMVSGRPGSGEAWTMLGLLLRDRGDSAGAVRCYAQAIDLEPDAVEPLVNYANILVAGNRVEEALAILDFALSNRPGHAEIVFNRGVCLDYLHRLEEASAAYDRTLELDPRHRRAAWNRGLLMLMQGRPEGWEVYESRWQVPDFPDKQQRFDEPLWRGEDLQGRTVLLHAEQGFGDTLQFVRYAPLIAARGGRVVLQCQKPLVRLLTGMAGVALVVAKGDELPPFDMQLPTMSAPARFETSPDRVPPPVTYASVEPAGLPGGGNLRVGLVWSGNPVHRNDAYRSMPFAALGPLFEIPGADYFSLQVGAPVPVRDDLRDLGAGFRDFADTAAAVMALDLVISVDTATVHLAGTLGTPTLLLLPLRSDWRWLSGRADTPWYPSVRIVRQSRAGDWSDVVRRVRAVVEARIGGPAASAGRP